MGADHGNPRAVSGSRKGIRMRQLRALLFRLAGLFHKDRRDRDLAAEMESHLQMHIEDNLHAGMNATEARRQALIKLGGIEQTKDMVRERRGLPLLETFLQDIRFGLRMLRKNAGFTATAVLALALGIGVNTTVFTAFDAVALRPRAVKDPDRLVGVYRTTAGENHGGFSFPDYLYYRDHSKTLSDLAMFGGGMHVTTSDLSVASPEDVAHVAGPSGFHLPPWLQGSAQRLCCLFASG